MTMKKQCKVCGEWKKESYTYQRKDKDGNFYYICETCKRKE